MKFIKLVAGSDLSEVEGKVNGILQNLPPEVGVKVSVTGETGHYVVLLACDENDAYHVLTSRLMPYVESYLSSLSAEPLGYTTQPFGSTPATRGRDRKKAPAKKTVHPDDKPFDKI